MDAGIFGFVLIFINFVVSYYAFNHRIFFDRYKFEVDGILLGKEYNRLFSSGFLHVGWIHLAFNMITLHAFSGLLELYLGGFNFLMVFFLSLLGGNLFALYVHRNHGSYSAVGASGAVSGVVFASIALFPDLKIGFFGIQTNFSSWFFGLLFVLFSIYGIRSQRDNIGHEAHLGGALVGMLTAIIMRPSALSSHLWIILLLTVPMVVFIFMLIRRPEMLLVNFSLTRKGNRSDHYDIDHSWNQKRTNTRKEVDRILDKIKQKGIGSLTDEERTTLDNYS